MHLAENHKPRKDNDLRKKIERLSLPPADRNTLQQLLAAPLAHIPNDRFRRPRVMAEVLARNFDILPGKLLSGEQEQVLFLQLNYARYRLSLLRRALLAGKVQWRTAVPDLLGWYRRQLEARSKIVTANMGLVLAMAKRVEFPGVEFTDLVSEGSMALLRAADKFDCARGFKFSTYACRAIFKAFSRSAKTSYRYRNRFPAQWDTTFETDDQVDRRREERRSDWVDEVRTILGDNLADLSRVERSVVELRFALDDPERPALTLKQVGQRLGLTKERIRQIQNKALGKLRVIAEERMVTV